MVIPMPYYEQHGRLFHSHVRTRPSSTVSTNSCILCRLTCCLFLFIIALFLFIIALIQIISLSNGHYQRDGTSLTALLFFAIAIISCKKSCRALRRYSLIINNERQLKKRLNEQLSLSPNNVENLELVTSGITNLPSYKELFPSHRDISDNSDGSLPSYHDFVKRLAIHHPATTFPVSSLDSSALTTPSTFPSRCIWITDQIQRPVCVPSSTVTYL